MKHLPFENSSIDFEAIKLPMVAEDSYYDSKGAYGMFVKGKFVAPVSEAYFAIPNVKLYDKMRYAADELGVEIYNMGSLRHDSSLVYIQTTPRTFYVGENEVKGQLTITNSHAADQSLGWGTDTLTIVCENSFHKVHGRSQNKLRHTSSIERNLDLLIKQMLDYQRHEQEFVEYLQILANTPAKVQDFHKFIDLAADLRDKDKKPVSVSDPNWAANLSTRSVNKAMEIVKIAEWSAQYNGPTLWGALSTVTNWTTHHAKSDSVARAADKFNSLLDQKAYVMALEMAGISYN